MRVNSFSQTPLWGLLLLVSLPLHAASTTAKGATGGVRLARERLLLQSVQNRRLSFMPAPKGDAASFIAEGPGVEVSLEKDGLNVSTASLMTPPATRPRHATAFDGGLQNAVPLSGQKLNVSRAHVRFIGSNPDVEVQGLDPVAAKTSFFIGSNPANWHTDLPSYSRVRYTNLYPGIDLICYESLHGQFEYDLVIAPGADPSQIRFRVDGDKVASLDAQGDLLLDGAAGHIRLHHPVLYQDDASHKRPIQGQFRQIADNEYGFTTGSYNHSKPLIVDPQIKLIYSTYAGGIHDDESFGIAMDNQGNSYIVGYSASQDFPVTANALQTARMNIGTYTYDMVVMKFDPSGTLLYSTFLGGSLTDVGLTIAVDANGDAYIGGYTQSSDFPTTAKAFQATYGGGNDAVFAEISPDGSQLLYSTFLGGLGDETIAKLILNADGSFWMTGAASAPGLPASANAYQKQPNGKDNIFVAKAQFADDGTLQIPYLTFLGGSNPDQEIAFANADLAVDSSGNVYVASGTFSPDFPVTANAFEKPFPLSDGCDVSNTPNSIAFVTKFSPDLSQMLYSTVIGGKTESLVSNSTPPDCNQFARTIHLDAQGNIWLLGTTGMSDFPVTSNALSSQLNGNGSEGVDYFIAELSADGSKELYGSFFGGTEYDYGVKAVWDANNNIWMHGNTQSTNYPVTSDALQSALAGGGTAYDTTLTELSPDATQILYSTYLGGTGDDDLQGQGSIAIDALGNLHLTGETASTDYPVSSYAFQPFFANGDVGADSNDIYYSVIGTGLIGAVGPVAGGNTGDTTVNVTGAGFQTGASCQLKLNGTLINATKVSVSPTGTSLTCTFPLTGAAAGAYDVVVTNPGGGSSFTKPAAFTVQSGGAPKLWVNIVSRPKIRTGVPSSVVVTYGNSGDVDAYMTHLVITMPQNIQATYTIGVPPGLASGTTVPTSTNQNGLNQISLLLPRIAAGASGSFQMQITDPTNNDTYQLTAGISKPWFTSESAAETALTAASSSYTPATSCVSENPPTNCLNEYLTQFHTNGVTDAQAEGLAGSMLTALQQVVQYGTSPVISGSTSYSPPLATVNGTLVVDGIPSYDDTLDYHVTNVPQQNIFPTSSCVSYTGDTHDAIGASLLRCTIPVQSLVANGVFFAGGSFGETGSLIPTFDACFSAQQDITAAGFTVTATAGSDFCDLESDTPEDDDDSQDAMNSMDGTIVPIDPIPGDFDPDPTCWGCSNGSGGSGGSVDPNGKIGPLGDGSASHYVTGSAALSYNVYFENEATASLPASQVVVTDQLDPTKVDLSTLTFGPVTFGTNVLTPPSGSNGFTKTYTPPGVTSYIVRVQGSVDATTGLVKWTFTTLDPTTNLPPSDPTVGFLPPDVDGVEGQGSAIVNIMPESGQSTGAQITNGATVVFDANAPIDTPVWLNTLDVDPPTSAVTALPTVETVTAGAPTLTFPVAWSGTDKGSGVKSYTVYVSDNGGAYTPWQTAVSTTTANYTGTTGHTYGFYSIATDGAGNIEAVKTTADTTTLVSTLIGTISTIEASATTATVGTSLTFTATIAPASGNGTPTGTVTFMDGGTTVLGTGTLASGKATFATTALAVGGHTVTAVYGGASIYAGSTSASVTVTITAGSPDFNISLSPGSGAISGSGTASTTVSLTPAGGFTTAITLACSGLPADASCSFSPASVTPSGSGAATSTMTITTGTATALLERGNVGGTRLAFLGGGFLLGLLLLRKRRLLSLAISALVLIAVGWGVCGCAGSNSSSTPKGNYNVTVTATSGSLAHTATYSLTVQ